MRITRNQLLMSCAMLLLVSTTLYAQRPQRIRFERGASAGVVKGTIVGFAYRDFVIGAKAGQTMSITLTASNPSTNFTIVSIGGEPYDMVETTDWSETLRTSGDYVVRVLMMRSGARRKGARSNFVLTVSIR